MGRYSEDSGLRRSLRGVDILVIEVRFSAAFGND